MIIKFKSDKEPHRLPIKRESQLKVTILFMLMDCDHHQSESIKIPESEINSEAFRKFMIYSYLCLNYGPKTKGGVEGYNHIKNIDLYFNNIIDDDGNDNSDDESFDNDEKIPNEIMMDFPSSPEYYDNDGVKYKFDGIFFKYYDEYNNSYPVELNFDDKFNQELDILSNQVKTKYNKMHEDEYGLIE